MYNPSFSENSLHIEHQYLFRPTYRVEDIKIFSHFFLKISSPTVQTSRIEAQIFIHLVFFLIALHPP
jgi:hypothetical protein